MSQRSPVIFGLLLSATLSVDAVAVYWNWTSQGRWSALLYSGLVYGQLSVCCIWSLLAAWRSSGRWLLPYVFGLVAALGDVAAAPPQLQWGQFVGSLWLLWTHVTVLLAVVWLLKQARVGRRLRGDSIQKQWQVTTLQLLTVTTVAALTMALWGYADVRRAVAFAMIVAWIGDNVAVATAALVILSSTRSLVRRIAMLASAAGTLWLVFSLIFRLAASRPGFRGLLVTNLVQAIVLVLWLELTPIIPRRGAVAADDNAAAAATVRPSPRE